MRNCDTCGGSIRFVNGRIAKCEYCGRIFQVNGDNLSEVNMESLYKEASGLFNRGSEEDLLSAIEIFDALGSYKDSSNKVYEGKNKISKARADEADRKLEEQRQNEIAEIERKKKEFEDKQKKRIVTIIGTVAIVSVAIIVVAVSVSNSKKNDKYQKAVAYFDQGEYEEAMALFESLGEYKDSSDFLNTTQERIATREDTYNRGVGYYEEGLYSEAIACFQLVDNYLDSKDYSEKTARELYSIAETLFEEEQYQACRETLSSIPETSSYYSKVASLAKKVDDVLIEIQNAQTYEQAVSYYNNEDFDNAQRLFISIGGYQDSNEFLNSIGQHYYDQANNYFQQSDYSSCCDTLLRIDTSEEWANYSIVKELFDNASGAYYQAVKDEARSICRTDGETAMRQYIDSMVCTALDNNVATSLKTECVVKSVWLHELNAMDEGTGWYDKTFWDQNWALYDNVPHEDNMGKTPQFQIIATEEIWGGDHLSYNVYAIDGQYAVLSGTISVAKGASPAPWLVIIGDGVTLLTSPKLTQTTRPYSFEVDVSGVNDLRIEVHCGSSVGLDPYILTDGFKLSE